MRRRQVRKRAEENVCDIGPKRLLFIILLYSRFCFVKKIIKKNYCLRDGGQNDDIVWMTTIRLWFFLVFFFFYEVPTVRTRYRL